MTIAELLGKAFETDTEVLLIVAIGIALIVILAMAWAGLKSIKDTTNANKDLVEATSGMNKLLFEQNREFLGTINKQLDAMTGINQKVDATKDLTDANTKTLEATLTAIQDHEKATDRRVSGAVEAGVTASVAKTGEIVTSAKNEIMGELETQIASIKAVEELLKGMEADIKASINGVTEQITTQIEGIRSLLVSAEQKITQAVQESTKATHEALSRAPTKDTIEISN